MGSNFTLNYGARYDLTFPFVAENNSYSVGNWEDVFGASGVGNLFKPGTLTGKYPEFHQLEEGERVYPMDWNNIAPSVGFAWTARREAARAQPAHSARAATCRCAAATADRSPGWDSPTSPTRPRR